MEINNDADLLNTLRVDPNYDEPVLHQVLRISDRNIWKSQTFYKYH